MWQQPDTLGMGGRSLGRGTRRLLIACGCIFVGQVLIDPRTLQPSPHYLPVLDGILGVSWYGIRHGMVWQPFTYMFLHGGIWHLVMNMLGLYFFGSDLEAAMGTRRFVKLYVGCGIIGGLGWLLLSGGSGASCIGASGAVFGVLGAFAARYPHRRVMLLFPPVAMSATTMVLLFGGFSLVQLVGSSGHVAHAAHLAGGLAGYAYGRWGGGPWNARRIYAELKVAYRRRRMKVVR